MASGFGLGATVCQGRSNPLILEIYVAKGYPLKSRYLPNLNTSSFSKPQQPKYYKYFVISIWHRVPFSKIKFNKDPSIVF